MKRIVLSAVLLLAVVQVAGQENDEDWRLFLDASSIVRMRCVGDSLWCATRGGVLLFDLSDSTFTQYMDGFGFTSSLASDVAVDDDASLWISFVSSGIYRIEWTGEEAYVQSYNSLYNELLSDSITCLSAVGGDVYYGSTRGVAKFYENQHSEEPTLTDSLRSRMVYDILVDGGGLLWVGCENGVARFNRSTYQYTFYPIGRVLSLCELDGEVYGAGPAGVRRFGGGLWPLVGSLSVQPIGIAAGSGSIVCVSDDAVFRWETGAWVRISGDDPFDPASLKDVLIRNYRIGRGDATLRTVAVDGGGTPWVGGVYEPGNRGSYVTAYIDGAWRTKRPAGLPQNEVWELSIDPGRGIWVSPLRFGVGYISLDGPGNVYWQMRGTFGVLEGLSFWGFNLAFLYDRQGYLWMEAKNFDLDRLDVNDPLIETDDGWEHYSIGEGVTTNQFIKIKEDPAGNRWFLADQTAVINILSADGTSWHEITAANGLEAGRPFDCAFGRDGNTYIALRDYGVQIWYTGDYSWPRITSSYSRGTIIGEDDVTSVILHAVALGSVGDVWAATSAGLVRASGSTIDSLTAKTRFGERGLMGSIVYDIEFDGEGDLWVATDGGLDVVNDEMEVMRSYTSYEHWMHWLQRLYPEDVVSPLVSATCRSLEYDAVSNIMWVGTDNGLVSIDLTAASGLGPPLSALILYPNPLHVSRGDESLKIARISGEVSIKIFTLEGELVHEAAGVVEHGEVWDLLTLNGYRARSGVYVVHVSDGGHTELRKVALVR